MRESRLPTLVMSKEPPPKRLKAAQETTFWAVHIGGRYNPEKGHKLEGDSLQQGHRLAWLGCVNAVYFSVFEVTQHCACDPFEEVTGFVNCLLHLNTPFVVVVRLTDLLSKTVETNASIHFTISQTNGLFQQGKSFRVTNACEEAFAKEAKYLFSGNLAGTSKQFPCPKLGREETQEHFNKYVNELVIKGDVPLGNLDGNIWEANNPGWTSLTRRFH